MPDSRSAAESAIETSDFAASAAGNRIGVFCAIKKWNNTVFYTLIALRTLKMGEGITLAEILFI
ncbi:hypothetical protein [Paenibacillus sonchi]|uniref:hypothetical protein n=1 Tax=Paenibacillus sonchi TaxID=373687 RepID=UPI001E2C31EF|nr:hypothetical protein [Paenibacillus sonchi]